ncbi:MAG: DNA repair protein RecN [Alphaproteobacteria bacterium]
MLLELSIENIVLIKRLQLEFKQGLSTLTGETGAGKSILLDSLNLALGRRAETRLLRAGASSGQVTASFELKQDDPNLADINAILESAGIDQIEDQAASTLLILRRKLEANGKSAAYLNDRAISIGLLRQIGDLLLEIQGQDDRHGLMNPATHAGLVDRYGNLQANALNCANAYHQWRDISKQLSDHKEKFELAIRERDFLSHAVEELEDFSPEPEELAQLEEQYALLKHAGKLSEAFQAAQFNLEQHDGAESKLIKGLRGLERVSGQAGERLTPILQALERALSELTEASSLIREFTDDMVDHAQQLQQIETRLFKLKELARKYQCPEDALCERLAEFKEQLQSLLYGEDQIASLTAQVTDSRAAFEQIATSLSNLRQAAASKLEIAVNAELPALKLNAARFSVHFDPLPLEAYQAAGAERILFHIVTNHGATPGPMQKIASGGELSRILLALKVALAGVGSAPTLIFDEVDSGIGGATAAAVGNRLSRLSKQAQILVITHSPQVAARGDQHYQVKKQSSNGDSPDQAGDITSSVIKLDHQARIDELARMLSGESINDAARAAALQLLSENE